MSAGMTRAELVTAASTLAWLQAHMDAHPTVRPRAIILRVHAAFVRELEVLAGAGAVAELVAALPAPPAPPVAAAPAKPAPERELTPMQKRIRKARGLLADGFAQSLVVQETGLTLSDVARIAENIRSGE